MKIREAKGMIDLKLPKERPEKNKVMAMPAIANPRYPYGLQITLNKETLKKMGMKVTDFKVGKKLYIDGEVSITRIMSDNPGEYASESMELQFTKARIRENKDYGDA